jgi:Uma2 family endonuclease
VKGAIYAAAEIPLYWIVNIPERQIEAYSSPIVLEARYAHRADFRSGDTVTLDLGPGVSVDVSVDDILP